MKIQYTDFGLRLDIDCIIDDIQALNFKPDVIVGIVRGGLVPAVYLSHRLNIPMETLHWQTRDGDLREEFRLDRLVHQYSNVLFVEDICDTGATIMDIKQKIPKYKQNTCKFAALVYNEGCKEVKPDFTAMLIDKSVKDCWVVFPWENKE